ncbi:hypothetical protein PSACC_01630 [Paramicrosporidium saccamoebae]|uniref:BED-type domain-containing protein n=1 Tax=Paramicrosporidium saccamoebae TaxID=1246581 RepID=A0A2H9TLE1_9FUNG|nr:hypothetical protein PSACC_01630 [Paramicrosporidium saccamoebae]
MTKKRKHVSHKPWCWYCDREFDDEKILITHQKAKHFKCMYCHKKLNSASGLVIHVAQIHKENISVVPNAVEGHDTPEVEIFGMEGVPPEDLHRHRTKQPMVAYKRIRVTDGGLLPLLAAQKSSVPEGPDLQVYSPLPVSPVLPSVPTVASGPVIAAPAIFSPPLQPFYAAYPSMSNGMLGERTRSVSAGASTSSETIGASASVGLADSVSDNVPVVMGGSFDNIVVPPSCDSNGKSIPGAVIVSPDLVISVVRSFIGVDV